MKTSEILTKAQAVLRDRGWARNAFAVTEKEFETSVLNPNARCFCAVGAVMYAVGLDSTTELVKRHRPVLECLADTIPDLPSRPRSIDRIPVYNDTRCPSKEAAIEWFDRAIQLAKEKENQT